MKFNIYVYIFVLSKTSYMKSKNIFTITKWLVNSVYFLTVAACTFVTVLRTYQFFTGTTTLQPGSKQQSLQFEVMKFGGEDVQTVYQQADNNKAYLETMPDRFKMQVAYKSGLGYYDYFVSLFFIVATITIVGLLRKALNSVTAEQPFLPENATRIRNIGLWLLGVDIVKLVHYLIFGGIAGGYFPGTKVQLVTSIGNGTWLGLLIICIAIVYQKAVEIYHDQQLTV